MQVSIKSISDDYTVSDLMTLQQRKNLDFFDSKDDLLGNFSCMLQWKYITCGYNYEKQEPFFIYSDTQHYTLEELFDKKKPSPRTCLLYTSPSPRD